MEIFQRKFQAVDPLIQATQRIGIIESKGLPPCDVINIPFSSTKVMK